MLTDLEGAEKENDERIKDIANFHKQVAMLFP
jgi:hypothetical protein